MPLINNMGDEEPSDGTSIKSPSYLELYNLRAELESLRKITSGGIVSEPKLESVAQTSATTGPEYRVVPDLSRAMTSFTGDESPLQVEDWLEEVKGMTTLNR